MVRNLCRVLAIILLAALAFSLASCSGVSGAPAAVTFAPQAAIDSEEFTISYLIPSETADDNQAKIYYSNSMAYLRGLLKGRGWNINFRLEGATLDEQTGELTAAQAVGADVSSGTAADGYIVSPAGARDLFDAGLVLDLAGRLKEAAPALDEQCGKEYTNSLAGLPLQLNHFPSGGPIVLYIQNDAIDQKEMKLNTVSDICAFLDKNKKSKIALAPRGNDFDCFRNLLSLWAGEQGYYPLSDYGMAGGFYAAAGDPVCTPVPIEGIPGFDDAFARCLGFYNDNRFADIYANETVGEEVFGYIGPLRPEMPSSFLLSHKKSGSDYTAFPLTGGAAPVLSADESIHYNEMAVCSAGKRPEQVMRFVQWALLDRSGYDLIRYGAEDTDYRMQGGRVEYLNGGEALTPEDWNIEKSTAFFLKGYQFIYNDSMDRATVYAPANYESLEETTHAASLPILDIRKLRVVLYERGGSFADIFKQFSQVIEARNELLIGTLTDPETNGDLLNSNSVDCLAALREMNQDTSELANAYAQRIKQLMEAQAKGE